MLSVSSIKKKITALSIGVFTVISVMAQNTAPAEAVKSGSNQLAILLAMVAGVLAFVIWGLGNVLIQLSRQTLRKQKEEKKQGAATTGLITVGLLLIAQIGFGQSPADGIVKTVPNYGGLSSYGFWMFVGVIGMETIAILFLLLMIRRMQAELLPEKVKNKSALNIWWAGLDKKIFTKATPVEKEADVLLDHNYDGIRELDNALPPWWKYGFYITIAVAFIYIFNFHVWGSGKNPTQEYIAEMDKARTDIEIYESKNKDKIDEKNLVMADAAGILAGQNIFETDCVACHMKGAGGSQNPVSVGPNLTDEYWIHKGSLSDIYQSIKHGYPDKGMQAWSMKFNPKQISQLASYIKSLQGTNPANARMPQGEMYKDDTKARIDSVSINKVDTGLNKKVFKDSPAVKPKVK